MSFPLRLRFLSHYLKHFSKVKKTITVWYTFFYPRLDKSWDNYLRLRNFWFIDVIWPDQFVYVCPSLKVILPWWYITFPFSCLALCPDPGKQLVHTFFHFKRCYYLNWYWMLRTGIGLECFYFPLFPAYFVL